MLATLFAPLIYSNNSIISKEVVTFEAPCYTTKTLINALTNTYKESPVIMGKATDEAGSTMSLWRNPIGDNWTIIATKGDLSCVIGSGTHFKIMPNKKSSSL